MPVFLDRGYFHKEIIYSMRVPVLSSLTEKKKMLAADLLIVFCALTWGGDYIAAKVTLLEVPPMYLLGIRFSVTFFILALMFRRRLRSINRRTFRAGLIVGSIMAVAYISLIVGIQFTTAGKAAFITSSYAVFVPFLLWAVYRRFPGWSAVIGIAVCVTGVALLSLNENLTISLGDVLIILCAFLFAANIVAIAHFVKTINPIDLTVVEIGIAAAVSVVVAILFEGPIPRFGAASVYGLLYMIILGTLGTYLLSNIALKHTTTIKATILFTFEAPFAAFLGFLLFNEVFTGRMIAGCTLIVVAVLITELGPNLGASNRAQGRKKSGP